MQHAALQNAIMKALEKAPAGTDTLLSELTPEQIQAAVLRAEEIQLEAAQAARTTEEFQSTLRLKASEVLAAAMQTPEEKAPEAESPLETMVTYAVLTDRAAELEEVTDPTPVGAQRAIDRIRGKLGRAVESTEGVAA